MGKGQIPQLLVELAGLDVTQSLGYLFNQDKQVPIRCAFADFGVTNGLMQTRSMAFDTTDTIVLGSGQINLKDESLALELNPRPKDRSILSFRTPLKIGGTLKDPSFHPDPGKLGLRGAVALALGAIAAAGGPAGHHRHRGRPGQRLRWQVRQVGDRAQEAM